MIGVTFWIQFMTAIMHTHSALLSFTELLEFLFCFLIQKHSVNAKWATHCSYYAEGKLLSTWPGRLCWSWLHQFSSSTAQEWDMHSNTCPSWTNAAMQYNFYLGFTFNYFLVSPYTEPELWPCMAKQQVLFKMYISLNYFFFGTEKGRIKMPVKFLLCVPATQTRRHMSWWPLSLVQKVMANLNSF